MTQYTKLKSYRYAFENTKDTVIPAVNVRAGSCLRHETCYAEERKIPTDYQSPGLYHNHDCDLAQNLYTK